MKAKNKILQKIYKEEQKRKEKIKNFKIWKKNFLQKEIELSAGATNTKNV